MSTRSVKPNTFVQTITEKAAAAAKRADVNGDGKISAAEATALPENLQDNLANYKAAHVRRGAPSVRMFSDAFASYVASSVERANGNNNSILSLVEAKSLPADLRDNFGDYRASLAYPVDFSDPAKTTRYVRAALMDHVNSVLFNPANPEGESFRYACLDGQATGPAAEKAKAQMLAEAATWSPDGGDEPWEKYEGQSWQIPGQVTYAGRFWQLYTEIRLVPGTKPVVYVEID